MEEAQEKIQFLALIVLRILVPAMVQYLFVFHSLAAEAGKSGHTNT